MYRPETVETFTRLYRERHDSIEYLIKFGSKFEKAQASLIKQVALGSQN